MSAAEFNSLLMELDVLSHEINSAEREILRKAQDRLGRLTETPENDCEINLLQDVIIRAQAVLGIPPTVMQGMPTHTPSKPEKE